MTAQIQNTSSARLSDDIFARAAAALVIVVLVWSAVIFLQHWWHAMNFPFDFDYGEGQNLDEVMRSLQGMNIYRKSLADPPFGIANFPPGYIVAQLPFAALFGPALWYGRLISGVSAVLTALLLIFTIKHLTNRWYPAVVGGMTLLAIPHILTWSVLARVDTLALCLSWLGIFTVVRWSDRRWAIAIGILAMIAAIFTRQSYIVAAPSAAFFWLWYQRGLRHALQFAAGIAVIGGSLFLVLNILTEGGFFFHIVEANVNEFAIESVVSNFKNVAKNAPYLLFIVAFTVIIAFKKKDQVIWLILPYLLGALVSAVTIGKVGSNINYLFELMTTMALCTGLYIATVWDRFGHSLVTFILLLLLAAQLVFMNPTVRLIPGFISHGTLLYDLEVARLNLQDELDQLNDVVKNTKGLILIDEYMALLPLQDRNIFFQPFEMTQLTRDGLWDETFFVNQIEEQTFSLIVIFSGWGEVMIRERWSDSVLEAIDEHYVLTDEIAATRLFIPRQSG